MVKNRLITLATSSGDLSSFKKILTEAEQNFTHPGSYTGDDISDFPNSNSSICNICKYFLRTFADHSFRVDEDKKYSILISKSSLEIFNILSNAFRNEKNIEILTFMRNKVIKLEPLCKNRSLHAHIQSSVS